MVLPGSMIQPQFPTDRSRRHSRFDPSRSRPIEQGHARSSRSAEPANGLRIELPDLEGDLGACGMWGVRQESRTVDRKEMTVPYPIWLMLGATLVSLVVSLAVAAVAARAGFPLPDEQRRLGQIDGLRGYLAFFVMADHFSTWTALSRGGGGWRAAPDQVLVNFGQMAVSLFFMITGFLFLPKVRHGLGRFDWRGVYISRLFRILPLQAVVVIVISLIALIRQDFVIGHSWISYPARVALWMTSLGQPALFGYQDSGMVNAYVLWSLRYEWTFYLIVMPLIAFVTSWRAIERRPILLAGALPLMGYVAHWLHPAPLFLDSLILFGVGMLVRLTEGRWRRFAGPAAAIVAAAALAGAVAFAVNPFNPAVILALGLFFLCVASDNRFGGLMSNRAALVLGECSFGIYMLHAIVLDLVFVGFADRLAAWPLSATILLFPPLAAIVMIVAIAAHLYVERPFIRMGHARARLIRKAREHRAASRRAA